MSCVKLWIHETEEKAVTYIGNAWTADMATKVHVTIFVSGALTMGSVQITCNALTEI